MIFFYFFYILFDWLPVSFTIWYSALLIFNISLAVLVSTNAKAKKRDNGNLWGFLTFFLGLPFALFYFLINIGLGVKSEDKKLNHRQRNAVIAVVSILVALLVAYNKRKRVVANVEAKKDTKE